MFMLFKQKRKLVEYPESFPHFVNTLNKSNNIHQVLSFEEIRRLGIVINVNLLTQEQISQIEKYLKELKKSQKEFQVFAVEEILKKKQEPIEIPHFFQTHFFNYENAFNTNLLPKARLMDQINSKNLDICINLAFTAMSPEAYLCTLSNAKMRFLFQIGDYDEKIESNYELVCYQKIKKNQIETLDLYEVLKSIENILKKIH